MAQDVRVMAFRKRLKSAGYTDVRIVLDSMKNRILCSCGRRGAEDFYLVSAVEPLAGSRVVTSLTPSQMFDAFQRRHGTLSVAFDVAAPDVGYCSVSNPFPGYGIPTNE